MTETAHHSHRTLLTALVLLESLCALLTGNSYLWIPLILFILGIYIEASAMRVFTAVVAAYSLLISFLLLFMNLSSQGRFLNFLFLLISVYTLCLVLKPVRAATRVIPSMPKSLAPAPTAPVRSAPLPRTVERRPSSSLRIGPLLSGFALTALTTFLVTDQWFFILMGSCLLLMLLHGLKAPLRLWPATLLFSSLGLVVFTEREWLWPIIMRAMGHVGSIILAPCLLLVYMVLMQLGSLANGHSSSCDRAA